MEPHVKPTWILLARRDGAKIFSSTGPREPLLTVREVDHPAGRQKAGEIDADRPGRAFDRAGQGRHAMSTASSPTEHVEDKFIAELAREIDHARHLGVFSGLVIVAGPKLLGKLRMALSDPTRREVIGELAQDLVDPSETELREHLAPVVRV